MRDHNTIKERDHAHMYERKLSTEAGRASLRPVPMARHFLTQRYTPSDVREMAALLDTNIVEAGFRVVAAPPHVEQFTLGEKALAFRLADPLTRDETEPRVVHDVDCVAAVLTLRKGHRTGRLEDARVVFATAAPLVLRNVRLWWEEDEHEAGIGPLVHIRALANLAWLKHPSASVDFKLRELLALCAAAMRPTQETWRRFLKHLESLRQSGRLTSDEMTAVVISAMSDRLLREAEWEEDDPNDIDATTLDDVIERVKLSYSASAEERVRGITEQFEGRLSEVAQRTNEAEARVRDVERTAAERLRQQELRIEGRARVIAARGTAALQWIVVALVVIGAAALIAGHPLHGGLPGVVIGLAVVAFVVLELVGILRHVSDWRATVATRLATRARVWLGGDADVPKG